MNGDIAHAAAYRLDDQPRFLPGHSYCTRCSTYKPFEEISVRIGGYCWDCVHTRARARAVTVAVRCISRGHHDAALVIMALALDEQARLEDLDVPPVTPLVRASQTIEFHSRLRACLIALRRITELGKTCKVVATRA